MSRTMDAVISLTLTCIFAWASLALEKTAAADSCFCHCLALGSVVYMSLVLYHKTPVSLMPKVCSHWFWLIICMTVALYIAMPIALSLKAGTVYLDIFRLLFVFMGAGIYRLLHPKQ